MFLLITGGSGSGKSAYAEKRICELSAGEKYYIAAMQVYGAEGEAKVQRHRKMRADKGFATIEQQTDIAEAVTKMRTPSEASVLVECMSNLTANEMFREGENVPAAKVEEKIIGEMKRLIASTAHQVVVTNKVFDDGITYEQTTMDYMLALGRINEALAGLADEVVEVVVGIPMALKREN